MADVLVKSPHDLEHPPKDFTDNLKFRLEIYRRCAEDLGLQRAALEFAKRDIVNFFDLFLWTYDPREFPHDRPFILYPYQEQYVRELNDDIVNGVDSLTEKTRDMGVTWNILGVMFFRWLLHDENFLVGSRKEELVDTMGDMDSHFERLRYFLRTVPPWILDLCGFSPRDSMYLRIFKKQGPSILGESMNPNFSRQGRYKAILLDEFAFVEKAEFIWRACGDSAPCKMVVSTPAGKRNYFATLRESGQIKIKTLHWRLHPKKDQEWYEQQKAKRSKKDVAQELDINYTVSAGEPFYTGFIRGMHTGKFVANPDRELVLGWDYGFIHPNCIITQLDVKGRLLILRNVFGENQLIDEFAGDVKVVLNQFFPGYAVRCFGDPAGNQESDKSKYTSVQILAKNGFYVGSKPSNTSTTNYDARQAIIDGKLKQLIQGVPALVIDDNVSTQVVIEALEGGYRYPDPNKYGGVKEKPARDGYYEHVMNSLEYIAVNMFTPIPRMVRRTRKTRRPAIRNNI